MEVYIGTGMRILFFLTSSAGIPLGSGRMRQGLKGLELRKPKIKPYIATLH